MARSLSAGADERGLATHVKRALMRQLATSYRTQGLVRAKPPAVPRYSKRPPMTKNKSSGNSTTPRPYASRGANVAEGGVLSIQSTAHTGEMPSKESELKKKKEQKKLRVISPSDLSRTAFSIYKDKAGGVSPRRNLRPRRKLRRKARPHVHVHLPSAQPRDVNGQPCDSNDQPREQCRTQCAHRRHLHARSWKLSSSRLNVLGLSRDITICESMLQGMLQGCHL